MPPNDDAEAGVDVEGLESGLSAAAPDPLRSAGELVASYIELDSDDEGRSIDFASLIAMVIDAVTQIMQMCPKSKAADLKSRADRATDLDVARVRLYCRRAIKAKMGGRFRVGRAKFDRLEDQATFAIFEAGGAADVASIEAARSAVLAKGA